MTKAELVKLLEPMPDEADVVKRYWQKGDSQFGEDVDASVYSVTLETTEHRKGKVAIVIN